MLINAEFKEQHERATAQPKEQLCVFVVLMLKVQIFTELKRITDNLDQIWISCLLIQIKEEKNDRKQIRTSGSCRRRSGPDSSAFSRQMWAPLNSNVSSGSECFY